MVEFVKGEGREGRDGLVSELKVLMRETLSDKGDALALEYEGEER